MTQTGPGLKCSGCHLPVMQLIDGRCALCHTQLSSDRKIRALECALALERARRKGVEACAQEMYFTLQTVEFDASDHINAWESYQKTFAEPRGSQPFVWRFRVLPEGEADVDAHAHSDGVVLEIPPDCIEKMQTDLEAIAAVEAAAPSEPNTVYCFHVFVGKSEVQL